MVAWPSADGRSHSGWYGMWKPRCSEWGRVKETLGRR